MDVYSFKLALAVMSKSAYEAAPHVIVWPKSAERDYTVAREWERQDKGRFSEDHTSHFHSEQR
jgi:hypothetical protein